MYPLGLAEMQAEHVRRQALRDASHQQVVRLARRPGKPMRVRLAAWLHALAVRIDQPVQLETEPTPAL